MPTGSLDDPSFLYPPEALMPATEAAIASVFDDIDAVYFQEEGFDATAYELNKLDGNELDLASLGNSMFKLKRQLQVVSKKVSSLVAKNTDHFCSQRKHYQAVYAEASDMLDIIRGVRRRLAVSKAEVRNSLSIVANEEKRRMLHRLQDELEAVKALYETEFRLRELVENGDFPRAIRLAVEASNAAQTRLEYECVRQLSLKFTSILASMESHIDDALAALTVVYDQDKYSLVYAAYGMLEKVPTAAVKLVSFFRATLETSARTVLIDRLRQRMTAEQTDAMSYEQLCEAIDIDEVIDAIRELGFVLCRCLFVYHDALRFHMEEDERRLLAETDGTADVENELEAPPIIEKGVMQKALSDGLYSTFKTAAAKFNTILCCHDLSQLKFDYFLDVVEMANRFRKFGRRFFGNTCAEVALTLEKQTCLYFGRYHRERLEELKMFLENEVFALCPVPAQFSLFDLQEFQFLKESTDAFDEDDVRIHHFIDQDGLGEQLDFVLLTPDTDNPFCAPQKVISRRTTTGGEPGESSRSSSDDSCYADYSQQVTTSSPNLCNTALNVLRFFGRYIRMTSLLHSVAEEAIVAIIQLFEYFAYSIVSFFAKDLVADHWDATTFTSLHLRKVVEAIRLRLILDPGEECKQLRAGEHGSVKMPLCQVSRCLDFSSAERVFCLPERVIGIESLIFLKKQFESLRPVLQSLVPNNKQLPSLEKLFKETLPVIQDIRRAALGCVASRVLDYNALLKQVTSVNFNLTEIQDQHSGYVDSVLRDLQVLSSRLAAFEEEVTVGEETKTTLWSNVVYCVSRVLVQGYSECNRKCTQEGRALMLLDFEHLCRHLEALSGMKPVPYRIYIEEYIKAFYLPESCLEEWIAKHPEYSISQVSSLLNSTASKRTKSRLMTVLENGASSITGGVG